MKQQTLSEIRKKIEEQMIHKLVKIDYEWLMRRLDEYETPLQEFIKDLFCLTALAKVEGWTENRLNQEIDTKAKQHFGDLI